MRCLILATALLLGAGGAAADDDAAGTVAAKAETPVVDQSQDLARARALLDKGEVDAAVAAIEALLTDHPDHRDARMLLGDAYLVQKKYQHALNAYSAVLLRDGSDAQACSGRARALVGLADVPKAIIWAKKATELAPDDLHGWYVLGEVYLNEKYLDAPRAEATFRQILVLSPGDRTARLQLARALSYQKKVDQAIEVLEGLAAERPEDWEVQLKLAESYYAVRKLTASEQVLEKILAVEPDHSGALRLLDAVRGRRAYLFWVPIGALLLLPLLYLLFRRLKRGKTPIA